jgi:hypothetical protein
MTNSKVTALTANTTPALTDVMMIVDDPAGTPASQKIEVTYLDNLLRAADMAYVATANKAVANTGAETSMIGTGVGSLTLAANYLSAGRTLGNDLSGFISETGTPTLNIQFKLGATVICSTGAVTLPAALSNSMLRVHVDLTCRTAGASGTVIAQGYVFAGATIIPIVATSTATVDTTGTLALDVTATWGAADPANTLTITNVTVVKAN